MADETVSILKELVQITKDNNRKAAQDSAIIKDGVISQKQLRKLLLLLQYLLQQLYQKQ